MQKHTFTTTIIDSKDQEVKVEATVVFMDAEPENDTIEDFELDKLLIHEGRNQWREATYGEYCEYSAQIQSKAYEWRDTGSFLPDND
jgi:hypothetical protein